MRKTLTAAAAIGAFLVGACGDEDDLSAFCQEAREVNQDFVNPEEPSAAADELAELDPPEEISEDWEVFLNGISVYDDLEELQDGGSSNLEEAEQFDQNLERYAQAERTVFSYLRDECEIEI